MNIDTIPYLVNINLYPDLYMVVGEQVFVK